MKTLSWILALVVFSVAFCEEVKIDPDELEKARKACKEMSAMLSEKNPGFNILAMAVNQPEFPGAVGEEGCIVLFDNDGNPLSAQTTRVFNIKGRSEFPTRAITGSEMARAEDAIKKYRNEMPKGVRETRVVVIFSNTLKKAACDYFLTYSATIDFIVRRGEGKYSKRLEVYKTFPKASDAERVAFILIAAEEIYPASKE